jgi:hypothetical protein
VTALHGASFLLVNVANVIGALSFNLGHFSRGLVDISAARTDLFVEISKID